jgi:hypothetical protein
MAYPGSDRQEFDDMDPLDPYSAANLIIQQHGAGTKAYAVQRMQAMQTAGDERGEWAWMSVFDAVQVLEAKQPAEGEATH